MSVSVRRTGPHPHEDESDHSTTDRSSFSSNTPLLQSEAEADHISITDSSSNSGHTPQPEENTVHNILESIRRKDIQLKKSNKYLSTATLDKRITLMKEALTRFTPDKMAHAQTAKTHMDKAFRKAKNHARNVKDNAAKFFTRVGRAYSQASQSRSGQILSDRSRSRSPAKLSTADPEYRKRSSLLKPFKGILKRSRSFEDSRGVPVRKSAKFQTPGGLRNTKDSESSEEE